MCLPGSEIEAYLIPESASGVPPIRSDRRSAPPFILPYPWPLPSFTARTRSRKEAQPVAGTARANVARPRRCSAAAPVFRPAHLTVGQAATRPLSVPGQRLTGWPSCATTDRPGYEGLTPPGAHLGPLGCLRQRGRWRVVSARAFVPSGEQALRGRRGTLSRLRVPAGAFGRVSGTASPWSPCGRARRSVGTCAGHQLRAGAQACLQPRRCPCGPRANAVNGGCV